MGPKKNDMSKKTENKMKDKIIEDKTFGLKNKNKSKVVQNFIKGIQQTVKGAKSNVELSKEFQEKADKKKAREDEAFLNSLYKMVKNVKQVELEDGEVAKNVVCAYFKAGCCEKGDQCEFSHDLNIQFNQGAFDIYTDLRESKKNLDNEINKIAEEKEKKRGKLIQSNIVCKFFLDAVMRKVYGWKWECPNGEECQYKHCLPKGYILTTSKDRIQEEMTLDEFYNFEEQIDAERERVSTIGTRVNDTTFAEWKKRRDDFRKRGKEFDEKNKKKGGVTGIQLFKNQANLFKDDENAEEIEREEDNQLEDKPDHIKTDKEVEEDLENDIKGMKINTDLFNKDENLDELEGIEDEEEVNTNKIKEEEEKDFDN